MSSTTGTVIGSVSLSYNENGKLVKAGFRPQISVTHEELKDQLGDCTSKTFEEVEECAKLFLASFFTKVSDIELRDMEKTTIETDMKKGEKYDSGSLKEIEFDFIYKA